MLQRSCLLAAVLALASGIETTSASATDGHFDTSWHNAGHFIVNPADSHFIELYRIRSEPTGKLLLAGTWYDGSTTAWWLGELFSTGIVVPTFGLSNGSGFITSCQLGLTCSSLLYDRVRDALVQPDGNYLVLSDRALSRTTALAHALDTTGVTGGAGHVDVLSYLLDDAQGKLDYADALALLPDGKILVAGRGRYAGVSTTFGMGILRLNSDLSLDTSFHAVKDVNEVTFAGGNIVAVDPTDQFETATSIVVQPDGTMLLVGLGGNDSNLEVARLNADGSLDTSYGTSVGGGKYPVTGVVTASALATNVARIIVGTDDLSAEGFALLRISEDGVTYTLYTTLPTGCSHAYVDSIAADSAGRILAAGTCSDNANKRHFLALRLRGDTFALDPNFGSNGISLGWFDGAADFASSLPAQGTTIAFDASGRPVIGGFAETGPEGQEAGIARLTYDLVYTDEFEPPAGCLPPDCN